MFRKKSLLLVLVILLGLGYVAYRLVPFINNQWTDEDLVIAFDNERYGSAEVGYLKGTSRKLRYLRLGKDIDKPLLVFVHGSPSSSAFWINLLRDSTLRERANLLAIDRPGYGGSGLGVPMIDVQEQAENVAAIIRQLRIGNQPVVLHGSSYGGTVSARLAMDFPDMIDGLLLQSASTAPKEEFTYWVSHPTSHWTLRWLLPRAIQTANAEKLNHQEQLEAMKGRWDNIDASTVILHGTDDWLIYPPNAYYSCDQLVNAEKVVHHMLPEKQHDLIWTAPQLLKRYLLQLLSEVVRDDSGK